MKLQATNRELKAASEEASKKLDEAYHHWTQSFMAERDAFMKWTEARENARRATACHVEYGMTLALHESQSVQNTISEIIQTTQTLILTPG